MDDTYSILCKVLLRYYFSFINCKERGEKAVFVCFLAGVQNFFFFSVKHFLLQRILKFIFNDFSSLGRVLVSHFFHISLGKEKTVQLQCQGAPGLGEKSICVRWTALDRWINQGLISFQNVVERWRGNQISKNPTDLLYLSILITVLKYFLRRAKIRL